MNTNAAMPRPVLESPFGKKLTEKYPAVGARLGHLKAQIGRAVTAALNPQYGGFFEKIGARIAASRAEAKYKKNFRDNSAYVVGFDPVKNPVEYGKRVMEWNVLEQANPEAILAKVHLRTRKPLSPVEADFLAKNPEYTAALKRFFEKLDEARGRGMPIGDLGPAYYPIHATTYGQMIRALGENWRRIFKDEKAREMVLHNLQDTRTYTQYPGTLFTADFRNYLHQMSNWDSRQPLNRKLREMAEEYRSGKKGEKMRVEADAIDQFNRNNVLEEKPLLDRQATEKQLQELANDTVNVGDTFATDGFHGIPKGPVKVLSGDGKTFTVEVNGNQWPRAMTEADVLVAKHTGLIDTSSVSRTVNGINRLAAAVALGFRLTPGIKAFVSNVTRTGANEVSSNIWAGMKEALVKRKDPNKLAEWADQGIHDDLLRQITEDPAMDSKMSKIEKVTFATVRYPDIIQKTITYEARKAGLRKAHPDWAEQKIRDVATEWTQRIADVSVNATTAPLMKNPIANFFYLFHKAEFRAGQLFVQNLTDKNYKVAALELGIPATMLSAMVIAAGGTVEDFLSAMAEYVPLVSYFRQNRGGMGAAGPEILATTVGKAIDKTRRGENPFKALPAFSDAEKNLGGVVYPMTKKGANK